VLNGTVDIAFNGLIRTSTVARHYDVVRPFATILSDMPAEVSQYTNVPFLIQFSEYIQEDAFVEDFGTRNINLTVFELVGGVRGSRSVAGRMSVLAV
jgi:hypothetical protein